MSYSKDVGEVSARYRRAGEVPSITYPSGTHIRFTAPGAATNGQYGLFEAARRASVWAGMARKP